MMIPAGMFVGRGDPYFSNVHLLLHGDGANASTTMADSSAFGRTLARFGDTKLSTAQFKWGGSSILFDGSGDYLTCDGQIPANGTNDVTYEVWARLNALGTFQCLFDSRPVGGATSPNPFMRTAGTSNTIRVSISGANRWTYVVAASTWYHFALTRAGGIWRFFVNGVAQGSSYSDVGNMTSTAFSVGTHVDERTAAGARFNGWLDDLRITLGVARYTVNFTPPSDAFPNA